MKVTVIPQRIIARVVGPGINTTAVINRAGGARVILGGRQGVAGASASAPSGPELTYDVGGALARIDYDDGSFKVFTYDAGHGDRLDHVDYTKGAITTRKQLVFNIDGTLHEIVQTTL